MRRGLEAERQVRISVLSDLAQRHLLKIGFAMRDVIGVLLPYPINFVIRGEVPLAHL